MTVGFALCGSFCTFSQVFPVMETLAKEHQLIHSLSPVVGSVNSRFRYQPSKAMATALFFQVGAGSGEMVLP